MNKSDGEITRKRMLGFVWLFAVCFFNTAPLFIISILANLESVSFPYMSFCMFLLYPSFEYMFPFWKNGPMHPLVLSLSSLVSYLQQSRAFLVSSCLSLCVG